MSRALTLLLAAALALPLTACRHEQPDAADTPAPNARVLATTAVHSQRVSDQLELAARVQANPTTVVHVFAPLSGRVLALHVLPGQEVRAGQVIGMLQSTDLEQAQSDYEKAKIEVARIDLQLDRAKELLKHEVLAQRDYDDLLALDKADHEEMARAQENLHILGYDGKNLEGKAGLVAIRTPRSGVVLDVNTASGELQRSLDNATAIATIADIDSVWIVADLFPRDVNAVRTGQPVDIQITGYPDHVYHGRVDNVSDAVDPTSLTLKVRIVLPNPGHKLKPQMYATVAITNEQRTAIVVPATAVIRDGVSTYVFLQTSPGKFVRRDVNLGAVHDATIEVVRGLNNGDTIVTTGSELLRGSAAE